MADNKTSTYIWHPATHEVIQSHVVAGCIAMFRSVGGAICVGFVSTIDKRYVTLRPQLAGSHEVRIFYESPPMQFAVFESPVGIEFGVKDRVLSLD